MNPLLRSDTTFKLYLSALMRNGLESSINAAVRRRDSLLASMSAAASAASHATESSATPSDSATAASPETSATGSGATSPVNTSSPSAVSSASSIPTSSQDIAQSVLASAGTAASQAPAGPLSPDMSKLATALSGGAGVANNPLVVTLAERASGSMIQSGRLLTLICAL